MNSNSSALIIPPSGPNAATNDIRALKPPVDIPNDWAWIGWTALILLGLACLVLAFLWYRKRSLSAPPIPVVPPHVRARQRLQEALFHLHDPREFCILVSGTLRVYLEERFDFHAPERTTEEFLHELRDTPRLTPDQKQSLAEFLQSCDLVKFARFEPTEAALRDLHESASRLVDETQFDPLNISEPALSRPDRERDQDQDQEPPAPQAGSSPPGPDGAEQTEPVTSAPSPRP
jgi:hypothetical protein